MKAWQRRALDFEVKAIESILGINFKGSTVKEKQLFVAKYKEDRLKVTSELLSQTFEEHAKDKEQNK